MSLKKDIIGAEVQIGSNEAQKSLVDLSQKTSALANENDRLRISQAKLKALGKEHKEEYDKVTKAISENSKQIKENNAQMDALRKTIGVTEMSTKQLSKRALELRRELSGMTEASDPARFNKLNQELIETERQMRKNKAAIGETKEAVNPLLETAKGLLPAFGWAAIGAGAVAAVKKIIGSTDELGTKWEAQMNGMKMASDEFFRTLAAGNWTGFMDRMREAVKLGKEYVETLDDMDEKSRALAIIEANARNEELALEEKLRNKGLSQKERIKAGMDRIKLEEELAEKRTEIRQQGYDAELTVAMAESQLSKDQLEGVMSDFNSIDKQQAKAYIEAKNRYDDLQQSEAGFREGQGRGITMANPFTPQLEEAKKLMDSFPDSIKNYAKAVSGQGRTTDEQLNKTVDAWVKLKEAQNSAVENIKKVRTQVNNLLAGEDDNGQKLEDKAAKAQKEASDKAIEILDTAQNERMAKISDQYASESKSDAWFHEQQLASETAYLIQKRAILQQFGQSTVDVDNQINQKRIESQKDFNAKMSQVYKELEDAQTETAKSEDASIDAIIQSTTAALNKSKEIQDKEKQILEQRRQSYLDFATMVGQSLGDLMADSEATFGDYLKNVLVMSLEALHQFLLVSQAKTWIQAATEGAPINPLAVAKAMAKIVLMEAAYQGVKGLLTRGKQSGGFSNTDGSDSTPDGVYHKNEFIASAPAVRNPTIRPILNIIDMAQRQGKIAQLNLPAVMSSLGMTSGKQSGGFATSNTSNSAAPLALGLGMTREDIARWEAIADRFENMEWNFNFTEFDKINKRRKIREEQTKL